MTSVLQELIVRISEVGSDKVEKRYAGLEKQAKSTEKSLSGVGDGADRGAKKADSAFERRF